MPTSNRPRRFGWLSARGIRSLLAPALAAFCVALSLGSGVGLGGLGRLCFRNREEADGRALLGGLPPALLVFYAFMPTVAVKIFSSFNCIGYQYSIDGEVHRYLRDSLDVRCGSSDEHTRIVRLAFILMAICERRKL